MLDFCEIDAALGRHWSSLRLAPHLEDGFSVWYAGSNRSENRIFLFIVLVLSLTFLVLDDYADQLGTGLLIRFGIQAPAILTGVAVLGRLRSSVLVAVAVVVPTAVLLATCVLLGVLSSGDNPEIYLIATGVSTLSLNLAFRLRLRHSIALCLIVLPVYVGLPLSGVFGAQTAQTVCIIATLAMLTLSSLIPVARRERSEQDMYLLNLRNELQSRELERLVTELAQQSIMDALTGIGNRRCFDESLARLWMEAVRDGSRIALALVDIDHFKSFNDTAGHAEGDRCLREVAQALAGRAQAGRNIATRYGGEEFGVLIPLPADPFGDDGEASAFAERLRRSVESLEMRHPAQLYGPVVTVSVGVAVSSPASDIHTPGSLIEAADLALYRSKHAGRNRVTLSGAGPPLRDRPVAAVA